MICCNQVTKNFCSMYGCANVFSAKSPCYLGPHADVAMSGPSGSEYEYCAYPIPLFSAALKLIHEKNSRVRPCMLELFRPHDFP